MQLGFIPNSGLGLLVTGADSLAETDSTGLGREDQILCSTHCSILISAITALNTCGYEGIQHFDISS